jgi:DNA-binding NarL/FixJ family response regulator
MVRVLLCDSHEFVRIGLKTVLRGAPGVAIVGEVDTGERAILAAKRVKPDVVLADLRLPGLDGVHLTRRLLAGTDPANPAATPAVLLMADEVDDMVLDALRAGASGILLRTCTVEDLVVAIKLTNSGDGFLAQPVIRYVIDHLSGRASTTTGRPAVQGLTAREREVLGLIATGMSNVEIGSKLFVGEPTVKYHVTHLLRKLGLRDRLQAAAFAYRNGLVAS